MSWRGNKYLTPTNGTGDDAVLCRRISLPVFAWRYVYGALQDLQHPGNWEEYGNVSPEDAALLFLDAVGAIEACRMIGNIVATAMSEQWIANTGYLLLCDGTQYDAADYPELWQVLDAAYRDDVAEVFTVPDLSGRVLVGDGYDGFGNDRAMAENGGEPDHTLTISEMPYHDHSISAAVSLAIVQGLEAPINAARADGRSSGQTGGSQPHNNMQPYSVIRYAMVCR